MYKYILMLLYFPHAAQHTWNLWQKKYIAQHFNLYF